MSSWSVRAFGTMVAIVIIMLVIMTFAPQVKSGILAPVLSPNVSLRQSNSSSQKILLIEPKTKENGISFNLTSKETGTLLIGYLGVSLPKAIGNPSICPSSRGDTCFEYGDFARLKISEESDDCSRLEWTSHFANRLEDCFNLLPGHHWYGGGETLLQEWPIEKEPRVETPTVAGDYLDRQGGPYGGLVENYWLISTGVSLQVLEPTPLYISWRSRDGHKDKVCFVALDEAPYLRSENLTLSYRVCIGQNIKDAHQRTLDKQRLPKPTDLPDEKMMVEPFWSTWAQYKTNVSQEIVLDYARRVATEGFNRSSHIEIDDHWETCYGEAVFDPTKFPNPKSMIDELKEVMGFRLTLWIHPFINIECPSFATALREGYFVKGKKGQSVITRWWQGANAGLIDFTNPNATDWWKKRLNTLQALGVDSFKFDAGETNWIQDGSVVGGDPLLHPNSYTTAYVNAVATYGGMVEVRSGRNNQALPIFFRMLDKDSIWGYNNGLRSLIPTLLLFSTVGYPFVLPDMIGGNAYKGQKPSKELFVRWLQANAFMPSLQFSIVPWQYDEDVVKICKDVVELREKYNSTLLNAAKQAIATGAPINRPLWWIAPTDKETFTIDSEYMLGDTILVAPVLEEGAIKRDIYLPSGQWTGHNGQKYTGPQWIREYSAPLQTLPFFILSETA